MRGWSFIGNSRKAHYFIIEEGKTGGTSLYGNWMLLFGNSAYLEDNKHFSSDNCKECSRKRVILYLKRDEYGT